jgi:hypothetical protein
VIGDESHAAFDDLDLGDWVGAEGTVMKTKKGELSVKVTRFELLAKALRPLPDKWHGLADVDTRFRQRYVDLIANDDARRVFEIRFATIAASAASSRPRLRRGRDADDTTRWRAARRRGHSSRTTTLRHRSLPPHRARAAASSGCSSPDSRRSLRSGVSSEQGPVERRTSPSSRCSRPTRRSSITTR